MANPSNARANTAPTTNVLLIGGGGREHALARALAASPTVGSLYATHTATPGIAALATPAEGSLAEPKLHTLKRFCDAKDVGLVVVGPEDPLAAGIADLLQSPTRHVFGPTKQATQLEADKAWAKQLMRTAAVPTPGASIFTDAEAARNFFETRVAAGQIPESPLDADIRDPAERIRLAEERLQRAAVSTGPDRIARVVGCVVAASQHMRDPETRRRIATRLRDQSPIVQAAYNAELDELPVIKAAGLAKGKGVILPRTLGQAIDAIDDIMVKQVFGEAGKSVLLEERIAGPEVSVLAIVGGRDVMVLPVCQDHKRLLEGDAGPNTGGMGAFCPAPTIDDRAMQRIEREIILPTIDTLARDDIPFTGVLYAGLMLTHGGPKVLEFNVRFGDPECQALMARFKGDLVQLCLAACHGDMQHIEPEWDPQPSVTIVLASPGYPNKPITGKPITGIEQAAAVPCVTIDHAGTKLDSEGNLVTAGGRVLAVTALGPTLADARETALRAADLIEFEGKQLRRDIAQGVAIKA